MSKKVKKKVKAELESPEGLAADVPEVKAEEQPLPPLVNVAFKSSGKSGVIKTNVKNGGKRYAKGDSIDDKDVNWSHLLVHGFISVVE